MLNSFARVMWGGREGGSRGEGEGDKAGEQCGGRGEGEGRNAGGEGARRGCSPGFETASCLVTSAQVFWLEIPRAECSGLFC